jgi:hypothetical protein
MSEISERRRKLKIALKKALELAIQEKKITGKNFKEETLRGIVMNELSQQNLWGNFPNSNTSKSVLLYEYKYRRRKTGLKKEYIVDIASISRSMESDYTFNENACFLAVELKTSNNLKSFNKDIQKCRNYISSTRGFDVFELAAFVSFNPIYVNTLLEIIGKKKKADGRNGRLLLATVCYNFGKADVPYVFLRWIE